MMGRKRVTGYNPKLKWIPPPVEKLETEADLLPRMAESIAAAIALCRADHCTYSNAQDPDRLVARTVPMGDKPHRVFLHLALISNSVQVKWHALVLHPHQGDPMWPLIPVSQWSALAQVANATIRVRLLELEPRFVENKIDEGFQWVGPYHFPSPTQNSESIKRAARPAIKSPQPQPKKKGKT